MRFGYSGINKKYMAIRFSGSNHYLIWQFLYLPLYLLSVQVRNRASLICLLALLSAVSCWAQTSKVKKDSSGFDRFNAKAEALFRILPVPIVTYSTEAGNVFGLAKFNVFHPVKSDTVSRPSKISAVGTWSTKGQVNVSLSNDLILHENDWMILSFFNYRKQPEYMWGIGNDVSVDNIELVTANRIRFASTVLRRIKGFLYAGVAIDVANYFKITTEDDSFLVTNNVTGVKGGTDVGIGAALALDNRSNRYNPMGGTFILATYLIYPKMLGSTYQFGSFDFDFRKYYNPWLRHVIAWQVTTSYTAGDVPFYDLSLMGGEDRMRGYYKGAYRDKVLIDGQVEYRAPIWNIFGAAAWIGTGRVASTYSGMAIDGFRLSYGLGLRIRVDSKNNANLRLDAGYGPDGRSGFYFNFAEAF